MTWKLYAITSGGAVAATFLVSLVSSFERSVNVTSPLPQAIDSTGAVVDLTAEAERLKVRLADIPRYHPPARDAFRFGATRAPLARPSVATTVDAVPPTTVSQPRPPFGLAGMATTMENGVPQRTAILSSLQGVLLVKEGDVLESGYRVVSIADDAVTLESTVDGTQATLRLSGT